MKVSIALGNQGPGIPTTSSSIVAAAPHPWRVLATAVLFQGG